MNRWFSSRWALPIGILIAVLPGIYTRYWALPDFWNGFIRGLGLAIMILYLVSRRKKKQDKSCEPG